MYIFIWALLSRVVLAGESSTSTEVEPEATADEDSSAESSDNSSVKSDADAPVEQEDIEAAQDTAPSQKSEETTESPTSPEWESLMEGIRQDLEEIENVNDDQDDSTENNDSIEDEPFNYKGNLEYSYVLTLWNTGNQHTFHTGQVSGDPQYYFNKNGWGPTLGMRFQIAESKDLNYLSTRDLLGLTTGLQLGGFRLNTSASWMWEQYFAQSETDRIDGFVTYQYDELSAMSGVLWENTLTYSPDDLDLGIQASVGFPFQINGSRDMGEPLTGSWQVSSLVNISFFQLGYTKIVYPNHSLQRIQIGSGILF